MATKTAPMKRPIHVVVVAGSPAVARACIDAFEGVADCSLLAVITAAGDGARVLASLGPDVIVVGGTHGSTSRLTGVPVVFLGASGGSQSDAPAVCSAALLPEAVRHAVHEARARDGDETPPERNSPAGDLASLSRREREVAALIAQSYSYKEIAGHLGVGVSTIGTHMNHIYRKLAVCSRREIVARYGPLIGGR